ncbi:hypothetical protein PHYSODRAFT_348619 [Phytophthora sojae]|uniref:Tyr recombinase domain-containing protein n=1 Tax=Phytophthora sojae (strain P6497) TaxID=1094619 RepID=G5AGB3_PHYSP|nr:hypothetical protein PHYSODRAFT_348619 [Phytophthora sojae]EGZ05625.1 hypothetical protein PHYSODRAFT_348619 [Phytophthora sojae]|eukprot:XP_009539156.1 hypothetical protein PHYSODRAFT_348619 [Phytophthora sojae]
MQGIKRVSDPVTKKQPITPAFLRLLHRSLDTSQPRSRLLWGSVLLGYFFLLRRSEYQRDGSRRHPFCLKTTNAYFSDKTGCPTSERAAVSVTIGLAGSKNDQYGRGAWRTMHATDDPLLCPKQALHHILRARQELSYDRSVHLCADLDAAEVNRALKALATRIGVPPTRYSTHSIRAGGATALLNGRADSLSIKLLGRWMSNCYESYPVLAAQATVSLSQQMIQDDQELRPSPRVW